MVIVQAFDATSRHTTGKARLGKNMINLRLDPWAGVGVNARNRNGASVSPAVADVCQLLRGPGPASGVSTVPRLLGTEDRGT